jgi:putative tricarboxylic transport membrane protein
MWTDIYHGLLVALGPSHLLVIAIGTVAGLIIGALPGLSAVSGVALLLPFTFGMDPAQGLIMLAAVYMSAEYGGSISAILINTPGTSGAACTTLDGTPLTRKGEAQEALYTSLLAGTVGGAFGALVLIFCTPTLAQASLLLGPAEIFWVAVAGLFLVASLSGTRVIKGLVGVLLGIAMTLVGQDAMSGDMRFTFNHYEMVGGIPLVPALLGLFSVASILALMEHPNEAVAPLIIRKGALRRVLGKLSQMKVLLGWTSVLGTFVGVVPGAGASISAFVAYGEAKRLSKNPEEFGHGSYEGVAAPECANNAVVGGAMVPLLGLGIPGSGSAAIMFGALTVHGIIPGPRLFAERTEMVYTFMLGLLLTVFTMLIVGLLTIRWSSLMVRVPRRAMVPAVLVLSAIGTYGLHNSLFDVYVMLVVGFAAYLLGKLEVPMATIALGLVLGRLTEESFQQSVLVGRVDAGSVWMYFLSRPLSVALMLLAAVILVGGIFQIAGARKESPAEIATAESAIGINLRTGNIILALFISGLAILGHWQASSLSEQGALFPTLVSNAFLFLAALLLFANLHPRLGASRAVVRPFSDVPWLHVLAVSTGLVIMTVAAGRIGFYESAFVFLLLIYFMLYRSESSPLARIGASALFAAGFTAFIYLAFNIVLGIHTPPGVLV